MSENAANPLKRWWFFISRLFILGGMMLFFASLAYIVSAYCSKWFLGVNLIEHPELVNNFASDPTVLNAVKLLQVALSIGMMVVPALLFPKAIEQQTNNLLQLKIPIKPIHLLLGAMMIVVATPMVSWMVELNSQLTFPSALANLEASLRASEELATQMTNAFVQGTTFSDLAVNLVVIAVVPAIAEELLFRGAIQQFIRLTFGNIHVAVIVTAIIFSAFHGQIFGFLPRMALGIVLGYLFVYSGSIWPSILAHFLNNTISVCISHFKLDEQSMSIFSEQYHFSLIWVAASIVGCVALIILLFKIRPLHAPSLDSHI